MAMFIGILLWFIYMAACSIIVPYLFERRHK